MIDKTSQLINKLINVRAAAMGIALIFAVAGCWMIFAGIKDQGAIDIRTPFITGKAQSGFVGVLLILASVIITSITVLKAIAGGVPRQRIKVRKGHVEVEWEGQLKLWNEAHYVGELLETVQNSISDTGTTTRDLERVSGQPTADT